MFFYVQTEQFFQLLHEELIRRGISSAAASQYVRAIAQNLSEQEAEEISQIREGTEIAKLAQGIVMIHKQRSEQRAHAAEKSAQDDPPAAPESAPILDEEDENADDDDSDMKVYHSSTRIQNPDPEPITDSDYDEYIHDDDSDGAPSVRGKRIFWTVLIVTLPLSLALLLAYFGVFGAAFVVLCALNVLLVAGLIGGAAVGAALSLIGIIYGITQLITVSSAAPGLYEIGLGVTIGGIVLAAGILIYNIACRLVPRLIQLLGTLFGICTGKLRTLFHMAKEACYKL